MNPRANARFHNPLFHYIIECVLMATGIAEHIHSTHSLPKVLSVDMRITFLFDSEARLSCPARSPPRGAADMQSVPMLRHG